MPGLIVVPVASIEQPLNSMRSRPLTPSNVETLKAWIESVGNDSVSSPLILVSFHFGTQRTPKKITPEMWEEIFREGQLFAVSGSHRLEVFRRLSRDFPRNPNWQQVHAQVIFCAHTADNLRLAKSLGMLANMCQEMHKGATLGDKLEFIHGVMDHYLNLNNGEPLSTEQIGSVRKETHDVCGGTVSTHNTVCQLAMRDPSLRELILKIVRGDYFVAPVASKANSNKSSSKKKGERAGKGKIMTHPSTLSQMGGVKVEQQRLWLEMIVKGELPLNKFGSVARADKAKLLIREFICEKTEIADWDKVATQFHAFDLNFVEQFVPSVAEAKKITENLTARVKDIILNVKKANQMFKVKKKQPQIVES